MTCNEDSLGMEVGYRLIPMVDFSTRMASMGRAWYFVKIRAGYGVLLPPVVHIRDNMDLQPARYRILMKGVEIGSGDAYPGRYFGLLTPGTAAGTLPGENRRSAFGLDAIWIERPEKSRRKFRAFTVVEASTVVARRTLTHDWPILRRTVWRGSYWQLLDRVSQEMPKLTEDHGPRRRDPHDFT